MRHRLPFEVFQIPVQSGAFRLDGQELLRNIKVHVLTVFTALSARVMSCSHLQPVYSGVLCLSALGFTLSLLEKSGALRLA